MKNRQYFLEESGVAAVEFALISPVLILILVGIIDYGLIINEKMKLEMVSRSTTEYMLNDGDEGSILEDILAHFYPEEAAEDPTMSSMSIDVQMVCECEGEEVIACNGSCDVGDYKRRYYEVTIGKTYATIFPYPGIQSQFGLQGHSRMQID